MRLPLLVLAALPRLLRRGVRRSGADPRGRRRRPRSGRRTRRPSSPTTRPSASRRSASRSTGSRVRRSSTTTARPTCAAPRPRPSSAIALSSASSATQPRRPSSPRRGRSTARYVADALSRAKNVNDVVIWNEANSALFWRPQQGAPAYYAALLAECYDTLHKSRRTVNVITSTSPHEDPGALPAGARRRLSRERQGGADLRHVRPQRLSGDDARVAVRDAPDAAVARPGRLPATDADADDGVRRHRPARAGQRHRSRRRPRQRPQNAAACAELAGHDLVPRGRLRDGRAERQARALHGQGAEPAADPGGRAEAPLRAWPCPTRRAS